MDIVLRNIGIVILCLLTIFDSYGQLAPTSAAPPVKQFELGSLHTYSYESTVLFNEAKSARGVLTGSAKDVGYQIIGKLQVASVWEDPADTAEKILQIKLVDPILHIKSRKAPAPEGFVSHKSQLESLSNAAFLVHWSGGIVKNLWVAQDEDRSLRNLKRGLASLFQFKTLDIEGQESDVSGTCKVTYRTKDARTFLKTKTDCKSEVEANYFAHPEKVLSALVNSERDVKFTFNPDLSVLQEVQTNELHQMQVALRLEAGGSVQATQELKLAESPGNAKPVKGKTVEEAVKQLGSNLGVTLNKLTLVLEAEPQMCPEECPTFAKLIKENRPQLEAKHLGSIKSASALLKLTNAARNAKKDEFLRVFKSVKNQEVLAQLLDLAAATQTLAAHEAALTKLDFNSDEINNIERYLWSLSFSSHPLEPIIKDLLQKSEAGVPNGKLSETLILTVAAMTNKFLKLPGNDKSKLAEDVKSHITKRLESCGDNEECKQTNIRAIKNFGCPLMIPQLLQMVRTGNKKTSVAAMKAVYGFPSKFWDQKVRDLCMRVFLQLGRRYDSSARTLAIDILVEGGMTKEELREMVMSLKHAVKKDTQEVGQYLLQRLYQISEKCEVLRGMLQDLLKSDSGSLNGYHVLAQRGMAAAFSRDFLTTASGNGSLVTTLELASGVLKRSKLDVVLQAAEDSHTIFTLGMFAGGLSSFVSSGESSDASEEEEGANAGMELTVLGVNVRPFVFFNGQGELMSHVWSGAGSERTPAFQALMLMQDHSQLIPLQSGFIADLSMLGAVSFELAGQISLSLWNRKANSVVEKNAGVVLQGLMKVDTSFVRSQVEFTIASEPRLNLLSDVNFYSAVALCLQLRQPDTVVRHNVHKVERIPGSKHRLRKSKYKKFHVPGKTYALNRKNNEMCNTLFESPKKGGTEAPAADGSPAQTTQKPEEATTKGKTMSFKLNMGKAKPGGKMSFSLNFGG